VSVDLQKTPESDTIRKTTASGGILLQKISCRVTIKGIIMIIILITRNTEGSSQSSSGLPGLVKDQARTLLLRQGLRAMGMGALAELFTPDMLERTQDGKPFIPGLPDIHFNLSHSGDYMACAFSDREVGLDLQEHSRPHTSLVRIAKRFFSAREYEAILALPPEHSSVGPGHPKSAADFDNSAPVFLCSTSSGL
jgi:hypothetical protein